MLCVYGWYGGTHLHAKPCGDQSHQDRQGWNRVSSEVSFSGPHEPKIWWICRSQFGSLQSEFVKRWSKPTCRKPYYFLAGNTSIRCKKAECRYPQSNPSVADGTKCEHDSKEGLRRDKETLTSISSTVHSSQFHAACEEPPSHPQSGFINIDFSITLFFPYFSVVFALLLKHWK